MFGIEDKILKLLKNKKSNDSVVNKESEKATLTSNENKDNNEGEKSVISSRDELLDEIREYNKKINISGGDKMPQNYVSDRELTNKATEEIDKKYQRDEDIINEKLNKAEEKKELKDEKINLNDLEKKSEIEKNYQKDIQKTDDNAIKNGIQRSSIVDNQLKNLDSDKQEEYYFLDEKTKNALLENDRVYQNTKNYYENSLYELNVKKSVDLKNRLNELKAERNKILKKSGYKPIENPNYNDNLSREQLDLNYEMIDRVLKYYYSMPYDERVESFLNDTEVQELLGRNAEIIERYVKTKTK